MSTVSAGSNSSLAERRKLRFKKTIKEIAMDWEVYAMLLPVVAYYIIFHYIPLYGVQIAFKDYWAKKGIWGSPWIGLENFTTFFSSYYFWRLISNTILISVLQILFGFPLPIVFALMINEMRHEKFKSITQTISYAPHFLSVVVIAGMLKILLHGDTGVVNYIIRFFGGESIYFMNEAKWFRPVYIISGIWQNLGWNSIIYVSALAGVDPGLIEAAKIDGANRFQRIFHVNLPSILPTIMTLFILRFGSVMSVGFEKVYLLQNDLNKSVSDVISTYSYQMGIQNARYSFATAIGLFNSLINFALLTIVNFISRKLSETSLW